MKKTSLILPALGSLLVLSGCGKTDTPQSSSNPKESEREATSFSEALLDSFKESSLSFEGVRHTSYLTGDKVEEEGSESLFIGPNSYRFYEFSETTESIVADQTYFKGSDGKAVTYDVNFLNKVETIPVEGGRLSFDASFYNPFKDLAIDDFLAQSGTQKGYALNEEKEDAFWKPIAFYSETLLSLKLTPYDDGTIDMFASSRGASNDYIVEIEGTLSVSSEQDIQTPAPYENEDYHNNLQAAYDAMTKAKNFTFKRTRTPIGIDSVEVEQYGVKISVENPKAVLFEQNGAKSGIARFGDDEDYRFKINEEGKVVRGESDALKFPFSVHTVKAEVFEKIDSTHFKARTASLAKTIAGFLVEKNEEALLIDGSLFGDAGCDTLILETDGNKTLKGFTYYINRPQETGGIYREKNEIEIVNVNETNIPYDFSEGKMTEPDFDLSPFVGTYEGYNVSMRTGADNDLHQFKMNEDHTMSLDGEVLTFASKVMQGTSESSFNAKWGENKFVQITVNEKGLSVWGVTDSTFSKMDLTFHLKMGKNEGQSLSWKDLINNYGWRFEDDDEWAYILKMELPTTLQFSKEERVDGGFDFVTKDVSNVVYNDNVLTFDALGLSFEARFFSKSQGIIKTTDGSIKDTIYPYSGY